MWQRGCASARDSSAERRGRRESKGSIGWTVVILLLSLVMTSGSWGDPKNDKSTGSNERLKIDLIVAHLLQEPGKIDPAAARLDRELRDQVRYESIKVLGTKSFRLGLDEVGRDRLPNGRTLMVKPIVLDSRSALISVDVSGLVQTDLRLKNDQLAIIGAEAYKGGKLVIALHPHF